MTTLAAMNQTTNDNSVISADQDIQWLNRKSCLDLCNQRRQKLRDDEADLIELRDQLMRAQKTTFVNGLCTLSRDVKKLTLKEFNERFGCDIVDVIRKQLADVGIGEDGASSSGKKRNRVVGIQQQPHAAMSFKTPAVGRFGGRPPMTIARTARRGERLVVQ